MANPSYLISHDVGRTAVRRRLEVLGALAPEAAALLAGALGNTIQRRAGQELETPCFVISGWSCRSVTLPDGRRQIVDFYIAGELAGYTSQPDNRPRTRHVCLTDVAAADASALVRALHETPEHYAGLSSALATIEKDAEQRLINQLVRIGRMRARERMRDLIAELCLRHQRAGIAMGDGFVMPLTQETLADALGMSTVHVNRTLQQLRRDGFIRTAAGRIEITDAEFLAAYRKDKR